MKDFKNLKTFYIYTSIIKEELKMYYNSEYI